MSTKMPADLKVGDRLRQVDTIGREMPPVTVARLGEPVTTLTASGVREIRDLDWAPREYGEQPFIYTDVPVEVVP